MLPYNRALHTDDYKWLRGYTEPMYSFIRDRMNGVFYRIDHQHRMWEYANVLHQLRQLRIPLDAQIHDTGSGGSFFPPYLKAVAGYQNVSVSDSMAYGDYTPQLIEQCYHLGIELPLVVAPVERLMSIVGAQAFDVTLCISVIEHVAADLFKDALKELAYVTKIGGYVMLTTDYFEVVGSWDESPFRSIQHTPVTPVFAEMFPSITEGMLEFVDGKDLQYRGDFVNNYSFVNMCFQRVK